MSTSFPDLRQHFPLKNPAVPLRQYPLPVCYKSTLAIHSVIVGVKFSRVFTSASACSIAVAASVLCLDFDEADALSTSVPHACDPRGIRSCTAIADARTSFERACISISANTSKHLFSRVKVCQRIVLYVHTSSSFDPALMSVRMRLPIGDQWFVTFRVSVSSGAACSVAVK